MTASAAPGFENATFAKAAARIVPLLFLGYVAAYLDRVNVGFAKLQMAGDLAFSDAVYGFGAGIFFIGYFLLEVPSNLILRKVGARIWLARIMITWGLISAAFVFAGAMRWGPIAPMFGCNDAEFSFYLLRFLLGAAEAGFYPGVILYLTTWFPAQRRARMVALFMSAIAVSSVLGGPISGAIMEYAGGAAGLRGWQWLFLIEAIPSLIVGVLYIALLPNGPQNARWLTLDERALIEARIEEEREARGQAGERHSIAGAFADFRVWLCAAIYFFGLVAFYAVSLWMPTIIQEMGVDTKDYLRVGLLSMIPWGCAAVAMVLWASHSDKTNERRWHPAGALLVAAAGLCGLAATAHDPVLSLIALTLVAAGVLSWLVTFWSLPTSFLSGAGAAAGIALINSFGNLGGYVGPDLVGRIRTATGGDIGLGFLVLAASALAGVALTAITPAKLTKAQSAS
jgi:sugar phosphate permease